MQRIPSAAWRLLKPAAHGSHPQTRQKANKIFRKRHVPRGLAPRAHRPFFGRKSPLGLDRGHFNFPHVEEENH